jgi:hypothetical protein
VGDAGDDGALLLSESAEGREEEDAGDAERLAVGESCDFFGPPYFSEARTVYGSGGSSGWRCEDSLGGFYETAV